MESKNGGPAFPVLCAYIKDGLQPVTELYPDAGGMSLRDYFAAAALMGMNANTSMAQTIEKVMGRVGADEYATFAYVQADAMLKVRGK